MGNANEKQDMVGSLQLILSVLSGGQKSAYVKWTID